MWEIIDCRRGHTLWRRHPGDPGPRQRWEYAWTKNYNNTRHEPLKGTYTRLKDANRYFQEDKPDWSYNAFGNELDYPRTKNDY